MFAGYMADDHTASNETERVNNLMDDDSTHLGTSGPRIASPRSTTPPGVYLALLRDTGPRHNSPRLRSPDRESREPSRKQGPPPGMELKETVPPYSPPPETSEDILVQQKPQGDILTTLIKKRIERESSSSAFPSTTTENSKEATKEHFVQGSSSIPHLVEPDVVAGPSSSLTVEEQALAVVKVLQNSLPASGGTINPKDLQVNPASIVEMTDQETPLGQNISDIDMAAPEAHTDDKEPVDGPATTGDKAGEAGTKRHLVDSDSSDSDDSDSSDSEKLSSHFYRNGKRPAKGRLPTQDPPGKRPLATHGGKTPKKTAPRRATRVKKKKHGKGNILNAQPGDIVKDFAKSLHIDTDLLDAPEDHVMEDTGLEIEVSGKFCSSCSDIGDHIRCAVDSCPVFICFGEVEGTSCVRASDYEGDSWYCPGHNVPSKMKYNILSQNTRQLDFHRTLVPFLYIRINLTSSIHNSDRDVIKRHLMDMYGGHSRLLCNVSLQCLEESSLLAMQNSVVTWTSRYPQTSVLVVLEAEVHAESGDIVYQAHGQVARHLPAESTLQGLFGGSYESTFRSGQGGQRGLIALQSGKGLKSDGSWDGLVRGRCLDWILGFGAEELRMEKLSVWLHKFVELAFLREADAQGSLQVNLASIHRTDQDENRFLDAMKRTLCVKELLAYTSLFAVHIPPGREQPVMQELVLSSTICLWGIPLPDCPRCGNHNVRATPGRHARDGNACLATVKCLGCGFATKGRGVKRPEDLTPVCTYPGDKTEFFWKPPHMVSPWLGHQWRPNAHAKK